MAEIIARFADGRLLVQESSKPITHYTSGGYWLRIPLVRTVEKVLSIDTDFSKVGLITNLGEVAISGDKVKVVMRRGDAGAVSGGITSLSGYQVNPAISGIAFSGNPYLGELGDPNLALGSGTGLISGYITITANVIGY